VKFVVTIPIRYFNVYCVAMFYAVTALLTLTVLFRFNQKKYVHYNMKIDIIKL